MSAEDFDVFMEKLGEVSTDGRCDAVGTLQTLVNYFSELQDSATAASQEIEEARKSSHR